VTRRGALGPHVIGTSPARLLGRLAERPFAPPLVGSGQPPKRTSESPRSLSGPLESCGAVGGLRAAPLPPTSA
jgi:hypothetical protein